MARGRQTSPELAATALNMMDIGHGPSSISRALDIPLGTVEDICHGRSGWNRIFDLKWFQKYREEQRQVIHAGIVELQKKALKQINDKIDKSSAAQATYTFGILFDKDRLASGEATEIHEVITKEKWESMESTRARLLQEIERRISVAKANEAAIVVEAESEPEGNGGPGAT